jgi:hypothetical protein
MEYRVCLDAEESLPPALPRRLYRVEAAEGLCSVWSVYIAGSIAYRVEAAEGLCSVWSVYIAGSIAYSV